MEGTSENQDEVDGSTDSSQQSLTVPSSEDTNNTRKNSACEVPKNQVTETSNYGSNCKKTDNNVNGSPSMDGNDSVEINESLTEDGSKSNQVSNGTESEDESEGLIIDLDQSKDTDDSCSNIEEKSIENASFKTKVIDVEKEEMGKRIKIPDQVSASESNLKVADQSVDYFERLENSLREFEKTLEDSNLKKLDTMEDDLDKTSDDLIIDNSVDAVEKRETSGTSKSSIESKGKEQDMKDMEKLLKEFKQTTHYTKVGTSTGEITDKSSDENTVDNGITVNHIVDVTETSKSEENNSNKSDDNFGLTEKQASSKDLGGTKNVNIEKKIGTSGNPGEAWSQIGMKRCPNCSFTTDQDAMLQSHTVLCTNRYTRRGEITLKFKTNRYGCESCLFTTRLRRNFEEHIAFHLLAQPYICLACVETFDTKAGIETHVKKKHIGEQVRCGLRGSKKVNFIVDTLHVNGAFSFTGRLLDKKVWMAASDMRTSKEKPSTTSSESAASGSPSVNGNTTSKETTTTTANSSPTLTSSTSVTPVSSLVTPLTSLQTSTIATNAASINTTRVILNQPSTSVRPVNSASVFNVKNQVASLPSNTITSSTLNTNFSATTNQNVPFLLFPVTMSAASTVPSLPVNISHFPRTPASTNMVSLLGQPSLTPPTQLVSMTQPKNMVVLNPPRVQPPPRIVFVQDKASNLQNVSQPIVAQIRPKVMSVNEQSGTASNKSLLSKPTTFVASERVNTTGQFEKLVSPEVAKFIRGMKNPNSSSAAGPDTVVSVSSVKGQSVIPDGENTSGTSQPLTGKNELKSSEKIDPSKLYFRKSQQKYTCDHCKYDSKSEHIFKMHVWKHFHITNTICKVCKKNALEGNLQECALVDKVMTGLLYCTVQSPININKEVEIRPKETRESDVVVLSDEEDDNRNSQTQQKGDCNETHIVIENGCISSVEVGPQESVTVSNKSIEQSTTDNEKENETEVTSSTDNENFDNDINGEDCEMHLKITSTYSLSEDNSVKLDQTSTSPKKLDDEINNDEINKSQMSTSSRSPIVKDSGNIFDKLQGTMDLLLESEFDKDKRKSTSEADANNVTRKEQEIVDANAAPQTTSQSSSQIENVEEKSEQETSNQPPLLETKSPPLDSVSDRTGSFYVCGFTGCGFRCMASGEFREHLSHYHGDSSEFSCAHCGHKSYSEECHFRHMLGHSKFSSFVLFSCGYAGCLYGTNVKEMFLDHWQKFHPKSKSFKCISCREVFPTVEELVVHLQSNILKFVQCPHCTAKDRNRRVILSHITQVHPGKPRQITVTSQLVCQEREENAYVAPAAIQNELALYSQTVQVKKEPMESTDPEPSISNDGNGNHQFSTPENYVENNNIQTETSSLEKRTIKGLSAEHHMKEIEKVLNSDKNRLRHLNSSVLRCPHCSYLASGRGILKKHLLAHRRGPVRDRPFACPYCPSTMDKLSKLSLHLNLHEGNHKLKVFFCGFCSLKTNIREKMLNHGRKIHKFDFTLFTDVTTKVIRINVAAFFCDHCELGFRDKTACEQHTWTHSEEPSSSTMTSREHFGGSPIPKSHSPSSIQNNKVPHFQMQPNSGVQSPDDDHPESSDNMKRFYCKECGKYMSRLPVLKQHMMCHMLDKDVELVVFKCSYCAYSSTSKLWVSEHSLLKHPGKLVRVKRRIDIVSATNNPYSSAMVINTGSGDFKSGGSNISIDSFHCDLCTYSCSDENVLQRHKNSQHPESLQRKSPSSSGTRKPFVVPLGNVYKNPVWCSECSYNTKIRLDLLRHIKIHPQLIPESEPSPSKEKPKQLLKVAIGKRRIGPFSDSHKASSPSPDKFPRISSPSEREDRKPILLQGGSFDGFSPKPTVLQSSLYFLGGDLLHLKLKPCFSQVDNRSEFMCQLCEEVFTGRYLLHKHILQHMEVSFYRCAYCDHGTLESSAMVVHIQKVHHKPIQHSKIEVTNLESKINKFIHNIKEREYSGQIQMDFDDDVDDNTDIPQDNDSMEDDLEDDNNESERNSSSNTSFSQHGGKSPDDVDKMSFVMPKLTPPSKNKSSIILNTPSPWSSKIKKPDVTSPPVDHPSITKMGDIYKCKICGYTVTARSTIIKHTFIHSKFKKFGCPFCVYRSHWKHDTIKHIRTHHPEKSGEPTTYNPAEEGREITSPPMPKLSPQTNIKPKFSSTFSESLPRLEELKSPPTVKTENEEEKTDFIEYSGGFRNVYKCLLCDAKFRSKWKVFRHFSTTCSQPMLGCSKCKFKDLEPSVIKSHIEEKHLCNNEEARIVSLNRNAKFRKFTIPLNNTKAENRVEPEDEIEEKPIAKLQPPAMNLSTIMKRIGNHFQCKECGFTGGNKFTVIRHAKRHKIGVNYQCSYCEYKSVFRCNVTRHMSTRHPARPNVVKFLNNINPTFINNLDDVPVPRAKPTKPKVMETEIKLENQEASEVQPEQINEKPKDQYETKVYWKCLECGHKANCLTSIYRHFKKAGCLKTMYGCSVCKFKSFNRAEVQTHVTNENPNKGAELLVCPSSAKIKKFHVPVKANKLQSSVEKETKDIQRMKDIFCPVCHLKASNEKVFQTHIDTEHQGMVMMCGLCHCYRTKAIADLQKHTADNHANQTTKFSLRQANEELKHGFLKCPKCDYTARRGDVKSHLYCHVDYKPYCCPYCSYRSRKFHIVNTKHIPKFHQGKPEHVIRKINAAKEKEIEDLMKLAALNSSEIGADEVKTTPKIKPQVTPVTQDEQTKSSLPKGAGISTKTEYLGKKQIQDLTPSNLYKSVMKEEKEAFQCLKCSYVSPLKNTIVSHVYHHMPYIFKCPYCNFQTYPRSIVTKHIKSKHPMKPVYVIDERFRNPKYQHLAETETQKPSETEKVKKPPKKKIRTMTLDSDIFSSEASSDEDDALPRHKAPRRQETGRILYCCHLCPYTSESCYHYRQHLATHGGFRWQVPGTQLESRLKCGYCSYLAMDDLEFNSHLEVHLTTRPFSCPYCDFSQYTQCKVKYHISQCHPDSPVEVVTQSSSSRWMEESKKLSTVMLVHIDPKVKLVDILSVGPEECERILTEANVSVVDFDCLNDERFTALANTLGISVAEGSYDIDELIDDQIKKEYLNDTEPMVENPEKIEEDFDTGSCSETSTLVFKTEIEDKEVEMESQDGNDTSDVNEISKMDFFVKDECGSVDNVDEALEVELLKDHDDIEVDCDNSNDANDKKEGNDVKEHVINNSECVKLDGIIKEETSKDCDSLTEDDSDKMEVQHGESSPGLDEVIDEVMEEINKEPNIQESQGFEVSNEKGDCDTETGSTMTSVQDNEQADSQSTNDSNTNMFDYSDSQSSKATVCNDVQESSKSCCNSPLSSDSHSSKATACDKIQESSKSYGSPLSSDSHSSKATACDMIQESSKSYGSPLSSDSHSSKATACDNIQESSKSYGSPLSSDSHSSKATACNNIQESSKSYGSPLSSDSHSSKATVCDANEETSKLYNSQLSLDSQSSKATVCDKIQESSTSKDSQLSLDSKSSKVTLCDANEETSKSYSSQLTSDSQSSKILVADKIKDTSKSFSCQLSSHSQSSKATVGEEISESSKSYSNQLSSDSRSAIDGDCDQEDQQFITVDAWTESQET